MREPTDLEIAAGVRRELSSRRVDLTKMKFEVVSGRVSLTGDLAFVGLEKTPDEVSVEMKFIEGRLRSIRGVKEIHFDLNNWFRNDLGFWEPKTSVKGASSAVISGEGLRCPECNTVVRFCPCCGKPLVPVGNEITGKAPVATGMALRALPKKAEPSRLAPPKTLAPALVGIKAKPIDSRLTPLPELAKVPTPPPASKPGSATSVQPAETSQKDSTDAEKTLGDNKLVQLAPLKPAATSATPTGAPKPPSPTQPQSQPQSPSQSQPQLQQIKPPIEASPTEKTQHHPTIAPGAKPSIASAAIISDKPAGPPAAKVLSPDSSKALSSAAPLAPSSQQPEAKSPPISKMGPLSEQPSSANSVKSSLGISATAQESAHTPASTPSETSKREAVSTQSTSRPTEDFAPRPAPKDVSTSEKPLTLQTQGPSAANDTLLKKSSIVPEKESQAPQPKKEDSKPSTKISPAPAVGEAATNKTTPVTDVLDSLLADLDFGLDEISTPTAAPKPKLTSGGSPSSPITDHSSKRISSAESTSASAAKRTSTSTPPVSPSSFSTTPIGASSTAPVTSELGVHESPVQETVTPSTSQQYPSQQVATPSKTSTTKKSVLPPAPPLDEELLPPRKPTPTEDETPLPPLKPKTLPKPSTSATPPQQEEEMLQPGPGVIDLDAALLPPLKPKTPPKPAASAGGQAKKKIEGYPPDEDTPLPPLKSSLDTSPADEEIPLPPLRTKSTSSQLSKQTPKKSIADDLFASLFEDSPSEEKTSPSTNNKDSQAKHSAGGKPAAAVPPAGKPNTSAQTPTGKGSKDQLEELADLTLDLGVLDLFPETKSSPSAKPASKASNPASPSKPPAGDNKSASKTSKSSLSEDPLNLDFLNLDEVLPPSGKKSEGSTKDKASAQDKKDPISPDDFDITKFKI